MTLIIGIFCISAVNFGDNDLLTVGKKVIKKLDLRSFEFGLTRCVPNAIILTLFAWFRLINKIHQLKRIDFVDTYY